MSPTTRWVLIQIGGFILIAAVAAGGWLGLRWINWKLSYGPKVEKRLAEIETRLDALEEK